MKQIRIDEIKDVISKIQVQKRGTPEGDRQRQDFLKRYSLNPTDL